MIAAVLLALLMVTPPAGDAPDPVASVPSPAPGFDTNAPSLDLPQPKRDAPLDPAIAELIVARLVELHLLTDAAQARDPVKLGEAIRGFQSGIGVKPTGLLDRKTIALMAL
jgi:hypothetical protein